MIDHLRSPLHLGICYYLGYMESTTARGYRLKVLGEFIEALK